jgi:RNA polymerase sigma factor (sigma-70 family)
VTEPGRELPGAGAEALLVRRCAEGEAEAWEALVARTGTLLAALARRMLQRHVPVVSESDVDEVVAEVYLALLRRERLLLKRYDPAYRLSTYLGVICRSEVGRFVKRRGRHRAASLEPDAALPAHGAIQPLDALAQAERIQALGALRAALAELPARDRLLLSLRYLEGLDYRAIGLALGLNPESVGQLLHRAKERLAARLPALRALVEDA